MSDLSAATPERPSNVRWGIFSLACGTSWLLYFHRYMFALIKPDLKQEWNLGSDDLGLLDSVFSITYTGFQVPLGITADFIGVRIVLTLLILGWSLAMGMHALAPNFKVLAVARGALGVTQSAAYACLNRISKNWFPQTVRTSLQGWIGVFFGRIGGFSANIIFGAILMGAVGIDWRPLVLVFTALGVAYAVIFWCVFRDSPRDNPWTNSAEADLIEGVSTDKPAEPPPRMTVKQMFSRMSGRSIGNLLALNGQTILSTAADNLYSAWIPLFLAEVYLFGAEERGWMSALPLLGGAIGGALGGILNDVLMEKIGNRCWGRRLVGLGGKAIAAALLVLGLFVFDRPYLFCTLLFFVKFFSDSGLSTTWGTVTDIGGEATATVFAFNNAVAGIGSMVAPLLYGYIAEKYSWHTVFLTAAGFYFLCALSWLAINCTIPIVAEDENP
ncbi:MAG: MFS transporter [Planctomycetota bacterium]|nr:MAG: MFS transporter [Planctomycetota bacterium]